MNRRIVAGALAFCAAAAPIAARDVVFLSTSDSHYRHADHRLGHHNDLNHATVEEMNRIAEREWPAKLGGGKIGTPRGVVMPGDVIDDGDLAIGARNVSAEQYQLFLADFGLDGTDGLLKFPVFEGWGNHDGPPVGKEKNGFSFQARLRERNATRRAKGLIANISSNGLHYAWDWDDVHFVQLNIYPADRQRDGVRYSPVWHDPQGALTFLRQDLAWNVGSSGRPVVLLSHCGFDTDWWTKEDWRALYETARDFQVVLYLYGHSGTGVLAWAPEQETRKWTCINDGQTDKGFFVIQITDRRLRAAMRIKSGLKSAKQPDGSTRTTWAGGWEWKWPLEKDLPPAVAVASAPVGGRDRPDAEE